MPKTKKSSARTQRRAADRAAEKLARDRERLARFEPGGAPERPIEVRSASVIEVRALSHECLRCGARSLRVEEHAASEVSGTRLRVVHVRCSGCGAERRFYFKIGTARMN